LDKKNKMHRNLYNPSIGFKRTVNNMADSIQTRVQAALDDIRPQIQMDGGDVELVAVEGGIVKVRLVGHCAGCPMSQMTLKNGIEAHLKSVVPEVLSVEAVR
jgi:Fe-S cluster biogenesis protein NfuA